MWLFEREKVGRGREKEIDRLTDRDRHRQRAHMPRQRGQTPRQTDRGEKY